MNSVGITEVETLVRFEPSPMRVLVEQTDEIVNQKPDSLIVVPDTVKDDECARVGLVVAVGVIDREVYPWPINLGDMVLFHIHNSMKIHVDGTGYYLLALDDVLGKFKPKD